jgi:hypothetical protein
LDFRFLILELYNAESRARQQSEIQNRQSKIVKSSHQQAFQVAAQHVRFVLFAER